MTHTRAGFFGSQKCRTNLYAFGSQCKCCDDSASVGDASGGNYGNRDRICDLGYERERSSERFLGWEQE